MSSEQDKMPLTGFIFKTTTTSSELPIKKGSSIQTASSLFCKKKCNRFLPSASLGNLLLQTFPNTYLDAPDGDNTLLTPTFLDLLLQNVHQIKIRDHTIKSSVP